MEHITVYAVKSLEWDGATYAPGAPVSMSALDAVVLKNKGHISLDPPSSTLSLKALADAPDIPKRRTYKRRDMQAEQPRVWPEPQAQPVNSSDEDA